MNAIETIKSADIRRMIAGRFSGHGGGAKLARALGVAHSTACVIRQGRGALYKPAALFGYVECPEEPGTWRKSLTPLNPADHGYRKWSPEVLEGIRMKLAEARSVASIARELGVPSKRLRDIVTKYRLRPVGQDLQDRLTASVLRLRGASDAEQRRFAAEVESRRRGGTYAQQIAYMEFLLQTPEQRADIAKIIAEMGL
jgi:transposase-like protein